ncbi:MAG: hypothetical protein H6705_04930 [Myxococcales bacterium]|nr:hypothetical protein [Myxococcales bacterium]
MLRRALLTLALSALAGCAINTDPILADPDSGAPLVDFAPPAANDAGAFIAETGAYDGCDVDWLCTDGCADDLDCTDGEDGIDDADAGPDRRSAGPVDPVPFAPTADGAPYALAAAEERWFTLGALAAETRVTAAVETGELVIAAYALHNGALLARSLDEPAITLPAEPAEEAVLRVVAGPDGARFTLARDPTE